MFMSKAVQKNRQKNFNELSMSIVCSSLSSKMSTDSFLKQKNLNIGQHVTKLFNKRDAPKLSLLKQSSLKNQLSLRRKGLNDHSMTSISDMDERMSSMKNIPQLV